MMGYRIIPPVPGLGAGGGGPSGTVTIAAVGTSATSGGAGTYTVAINVPSGTKKLLVCAGSTMFSTPVEAATSVVWDVATANEALSLVASSRSIQEIDANNHNVVEWWQKNNPTAGNLLVTITKPNATCECYGQAFAMDITGGSAIALRTPVILDNNSDSISQSVTTAVNEIVLSVVVIIDGDGTPQDVGYAAPDNTDRGEAWIGNQVGSYFGSSSEAGAGSSVSKGWTYTGTVHESLPGSAISSIAVQPA